MASIRSSCFLDSMKNKNRSVMNIMKGADIKIVDLMTDKGEIILEIPMIKKIFAIFEPMTFPTTIFPNPFLAADSATPNSGREVPIAIKLNPMKVWGIWKKFAKNTAPSTRSLAP